MSIKKFEDFENSLEEDDKKLRNSDFKAAMTELFGPFEGDHKSCINLGPLYIYSPDSLSAPEDRESKDTLLINRGAGTPFVRVKILGFAE